MKIFKNRSESPLMSGFIPTRQPWPLLAACVCACSPVAQADPYSTEILSDSPLAYFRFDDGVATDDRDAADNLGSLGAAARAYWGSTTTRSVTGALTADANTAVRTAGTAASAMSVPYQAGLNVQGSFSVEAWLKIPASSALSPCILSSLHAADPRAGWTLIQGSSAQGFRFRTYNKNGVNSAVTINSGAITPNTWYHVVAVWDDAAKVAKIYQNGALKATSSAVVPVAPATRAFEANTDASFTIGMMPDSTVPWSGDLDEVAYYPAALTLAQVQAHYTNGTNASRPQPYQEAVLADIPAGYWRLGEGAFVPRTPAPVAANAGSLGTAANGAYFAGSRNTASGPNSASGFPGFGAAPNSALALESGAGYVGTAVSLLNNRAAYTVCGWVKRGATRSTRGGFFGQNDLLEFGEADNGGKLEAWTPASGSLLNPSGLIPNYPFVNNAWGFVCVTGNASRATLYFDGVQAATWSGNASLGASAFLFNIGGGGISNPSGDYFLGGIDEVAVFDKAFPADRVRTLHDTALGGVPVELADAPTVAPGDFIPEGQRYTLTAPNPTRGSGPFTYRWFANDVVIAGATDRTYTVASAVVPAGGSIRYVVEIDNDAGDPVASWDTYVTISQVLVWDGRAAANPTFWDVSTTANWVPLVGGTAGAYNDNSGVLFNDAAASGTVEIQVAVAPPSVAFDNTTLPYTISGTGEGAGITGLAGLVKNGAGKATVATANTYSGGTTLNAGILAAGNATAFGEVGSATMAFGPGSTGTLQLNGFSIQLASLNSDANVGTPVIESGSATAGTDVLTVSGSTASTFAGVLRDGATRTLGLAKTGGNLTLAGAVSNTHTGITLVEGTGVFSLNKTGGAVAIAGGATVQLGTGTTNQTYLRTLPNQQFGTSNGGVVLDFANASGNWMRCDLLGTTQTLAGIRTGTTTTQGSGVIQNGGVGVGSASPATLVLNGSGDYVFNGYIRDQDNVASAPLSLVKNGPGTQTLVGGFIDYNGPTTLAAGRLRLLDLDDIWTSGIAISEIATVEFDTTSRNFQAVTGTVITGTGTIVKTGTGTFTTGTASGYFRWNATGGLIDVRQGMFNNDYCDQAVAWVNNKASLNVAAGAVANMVGGNILSVDALTGAGTVQDNNNWGTGVITVGVNNGSGEFTGSVRQAGGPIRLVKTGTGTQTLSGTTDNDSLAVAVTGGTLVLAKDAANQRAAAGVDNVGAGGVLKLAGTGGDQIYGGSGSGSVSLVAMSGGILDFNGRNEGWDRLTGTGTVTNTAVGTTSVMTLGESNGGSLFAGTIADGAGILALTKVGAGTLTLTGTNTYTGDTTVNGGVLAVDGDAIKDTNKLVINGGKVAATGMEVVGSLYFGTEKKADGTWGATGSDAANIDDAHFSGIVGVVKVGAGETFGSWIGGFAFAPGADKTPTGDPDHDGIPNAVEMVLGGNPATGMDAALMPTITLVTNPVGVPAGNYLLFTYRRADQAVAAGLAIGCEHDTDLVPPWTPAQAPAATILTDDNFVWTNPAVANTDRVRVYVPRGSNARLFGRLNVTVP